METYKGEINEFIDWISGINSVTGTKLSGVTEETPISGQSIRNLIQSHIKTPFVTFKDDKGGYIRFFSSEEALNMWKVYSDGTDPLYDQEKADSLVLYNMDLPAVYKITGLDSFTYTRYIIQGNEDSQNALLNYTIGVEDSLGETQADVVRVTYTIVDPSQNTTFTDTDSVETGKSISKNIYRYLKPGENKVTVEAIANNNSAKTTKQFSIYLVTFSISSDFGGYYNGVSNSPAFQFNVKVERSVTNLNVLTTVSIDGRVASRNDSNHSNAVYKNTGTQGTFTQGIDIYNSYDCSTEEAPQKHTMTIISEMTDAETQTSFQSNVLIYEFEVRPQNDELIYQFVNLAYSVASSNYTTEQVDNVLLPVITASQYTPFTIDWGYYTDSSTYNQQIDVQWAIRTGQSGHYDYKEVASIRGIKGTKPQALSFIPSTSLSYELDNSFLVARIDNVDISAYPLIVKESNISISETTNYSLKLSAYGKTNDSDLKNQWIDAENSVYTVFSPGVKFDNTTGWNNNSLVLKGTEAVATIQYCPFPTEYNGQNYTLQLNGAAFEIDFKPEYVSNENDVLLSIGDVTKHHIEIRPTRAAYYEGGSPIVQTNYKSGERIKLAFIFNKVSEISSDSGLIYIVNNGILERVAAKGSSYGADDNGKITIGGTNSSIRVYMIRAYRFDITPKQALDNFMFDNVDDINLISRNDIYGQSSEITYTGLLGKQDIITIEGDLTNILRNAAAKNDTTVNITRISNTDSTKDFAIQNCRIRNHGQSTLSYPITSMKIWFNKSGKEIEQIGENGTTTVVEVTPTLTCKEQEYLGLNKNRYVMKSGAIPSNKFVLQANYADSSGAHNGSLLRLIQDTWYNAKFGNDNQFKLRTAPQLFASGLKITHDDERLGEDGWVEGVYNVDTSVDGYNSNWSNKTWTEISGLQFPYVIRNAADSFPCCVFYKDTSLGQNDLTFLGQYVFMDDKKSDYIYGERSIYYTEDPSDPFCLKTKNRKLDVAQNKVWDNKNVLQIEVVYPNSPLTSYVSKEIASEYTLTDDDELIPAPGATRVRFDQPIQYDSSGNPTLYQWEQHFELIYPDKDDLKDKNNNFDSQKFVSTVQPFMEFLDWITDVSALSSTGNKLGSTGAKAWVTQAELNKFKLEAYNHLDLYKLAAYYIFFSRFGLVDSVERNAQLKTYDGQHWHYEPWDMDIALGCANNGVIAYEPPITRDSRAGGSSYVFAGRSANQSNVLWDCLECWDVWMDEIVPEVAQALYDAGLTYENASHMFDEEYVNKWSETIYNESGHYKYIDATNNPKYRQYLNGARMSHRHWWLSKSMNYYDAKWACGDFAKHSIQFRITKEASGAGTNLIKIYPTNNTFFKAQRGAQGGEGGVTVFGDGLTEALINVGASIDASSKFDDKEPVFIFGATSIEGLDLSTLLVNSFGGNIGRGYTDIDFGGAYDNVLGAQLKWVKLGAPCTPDLYLNPDATSYINNMSIWQNAITGTNESKQDALENLELVDVVGWSQQSVANPNPGWLSELFMGQGYDRRNIKTLYAMGCDSANEFSTSLAGNTFKDLRLPTSIRTLTFTNSSWENISFWQTTLLSNQQGRYDKVPIPASIDTIQFMGTTGKNTCSWDLVKAWIQSIEDSLPVDHTEQDLLNALQNKTLIADQLNWDDDAGITYTDIVRLGHFGNGGYTYPLKGYVVMSEEEEPLTSTQLLSLTELFGVNVFNIGTINSNLVIDHKRKSVRISISAKAGLTIQNDNIYVQEPLIGSNAARLVANHFTLTASTAENLIVNNISDLDRLTDNNYLWTFVDDPSSVGGASGSTYKYASLRLGADGQVRLEVDESDGVAYNINVRVYYKDGAQRVQDTLTLTTIPVTFPDHYEFYTYGDTVREFNYTSNIATDLFGQGFALLNPLPPIYIIGKSNHKSEFALRPYPAKQTTSVGPGGIAQYVTNWTATEKSVEYLLYSYTNNADRTEVMTKEELGSGDSTTHNLGLDTTVKYSKDAVYGGINIVVDGAVSDQPKLYCIQVRVKIGGKETQINNLYFVVVNDNDVIVPANGSPLAVGLYNKYIELYYSGQQSIPGAFPMYKMHLLSLYGELDFSSQSTNTISSIMTTKGDTVLKYIPNVTQLIFDGCSSLYKVDPQTNQDSFDFSNLSKLTSISMNGCTQVVGTLDFSNNTELESIDVRNTTLGITLPTSSKLTTLQLGSPTSVDIRSPKYLNTNGVSIQSKVNLDTINLVHVNTGDIQTPAQLCGFNIFNTLYT